MARPNTCPPGTLECNCFWNKGLCRCNKVRIPWIRIQWWVVSQETGKEQTHTQGKGTCEVELKTEIGAKLPQAQEHQEPAEDGEQGQGSFSLGVTGGSTACTHLGFELWPLGLRGNHFLLFWSHLLCIVAAVLASCNTVRQLSKLFYNFTYLVRLYLTRNKKVS